MREGEIALAERYERVIEEYNYIDLNIQADNIIEIEKWCKEKNEGKPEYSRRLPQKIKEIKSAEEKREYSLRTALSTFKEKEIWKTYQEGKEQGLSREEIKQKYGMREGEIALVERYERVIEEYDYWKLNVHADNIIEIEKWCKEQFEGKPEYSRRLPRTITRNKVSRREKREQFKNLFKYF